MTASVIPGLHSLAPVDMDALIQEARLIFAARRASAMAAGACSGCGDPLPPHAIKWCSDACRKAQYANRCAGCGIEISAGTATTGPRRCSTCARIMQARWSREIILERIHEWNQRFGRPPATNEWSRTLARKLGYLDAIAVLDADPHHWPYPATVSQYFGTWSGAIAAAGLQPARPGRRGAADARRPLTEATA